MVTYQQDLTLHEFTTWTRAQFMKWIEDPLGQVLVYEYIYGSMSFSLEYPGPLGEGVFGKANSNEKLVALAIQANGEAERFVREDGFVKVYNALRTFVENGEPGHDMGHVLRDVHRAVYMLEDPTVKRASQAEKVAYLLAGMGHDFSTSIVLRYVDDKIVGHAEVSGYILGRTLEDMGYPNLAVIVAYAAAAHKHNVANMYYKATELEGSPIIRRPFYPFELFEQDGVAYGIATVGARFTDRGSIGLMMALRHIVAGIGATLFTKAGDAVDLAGGTAARVALDDDSNHAIVTPSLESPHEGKRTMFAHITGYLGSVHPDIGGNIENDYNYYDPMFPRFQNLMMLNQEVWAEVMNALNEATERRRGVKSWVGGGVDLDAVWQEFADLVAWCNLSPHTPLVLAEVRKYFDMLTPQQVAIWADVLPVMREGYEELLDWTYQQALDVCETHPWAPQLLPVLAAAGEELAYDEDRIEDYLEEADTYYQAQPA